MGFLNKVLGGEKAEPEVEAPPCPHTSLIQRWDNPEDMGKKELARYVCTACEQTFSYEAAQCFLEGPDAPPPPPEADVPHVPQIFDDESKEPAETT